MDILNSKIFGKGDQHLIITHGIFGSLDNWNTLGKQFAEHFTTHLVDLRNHGRSFHNDEVSHDVMAQDFVHYMEYHNISQAHFLGHSLGGKVVMSLALNHSNKVNKLIVADIAPKTYSPHHQDIIKGLESVDFAQVSRRSDVDKYLQAYIPELSTRQFLMKSVYRKSEGEYGYRFNLPALSVKYNELVSNTLPDKTFDHPTLFLGGEESSYILKEDMPELQRYFPNAQLTYVSKAGHWLHAQNPEEFMQKTLDFLLD